MALYGNGRFQVARGNDAVITRNAESAAGESTDNRRLFIHRPTKWVVYFEEPDPVRYG